MNSRRTDGEGDRGGEHIHINRGRQVLTRPNPKYSAKRLFKAGSESKAYKIGQQA